VGLALISGKHTEDLSIDADGGPKASSAQSLTLLLNRPQREWLPFFKSRIRREGDWAEIVELMPPASAESIPIPVYAARAWLNQEAVTASEVADAEGYKVPETEQETKKPRYALLWLGSAEGQF
jgi:hypothetical protein